MFRYYVSFFLLLTLFISDGFSMTKHRLVLKKNQIFEVKDELLENESHIYNQIFAYDVELKEEGIDYLDKLIDDNMIEYYEWIQP
ncbi:hypothetical protein N9N67_12135 [Bacteriovoracaceae bacterium]|nr:hypothetical protein [Bacteriovoracaceae bacterium]